MALFNMPDRCINKEVAMIFALVIFILGSRFWLIPNQIDSKEQTRLFSESPVIPPRYYLLIHLSGVLLLCLLTTWQARAR